ncbi:MAG: FxsA family protein [Actinomycetota bacterium]|nr:FxsA family protein [Actinomycetota bacterium]
MGLLLVVLFLVVPIIEIYVIVQVGQVVGVGPTILLLLLESALGAWLVKREGRRAWQALRGAFVSGRLPNVELADAALVLVGGTLLLTPGFVTDVFGFLLVLPASRPLFRRALARVVARRAQIAVSRRVAAPSDAGQPPRSSGNGREPRVIPGEVVGGDETGRAAGG